MPPPRLFRKAPVLRFDLLKGGQVASFTASPLFQGGRCRRPGTGERRNYLTCKNLAVTGRENRNPILDGFVRSPSAAWRFIPALLNSRGARRRSRFNRVNHCSARLGTPQSSGFARLLRPVAGEPLTVPSPLATSSEIIDAWSVAGPRRATSSSPHVCSGKTAGATNGDVDGLAGSQPTGGTSGRREFRISI
jgi:hypothetical protein